MIDKDGPTECKSGFADAPNTAVITLTSIIDGRNPILYVSHDDDDGCWQFLDGQAADITQALIVALHTIVEIAPEVLDVSDLLEGWIAYREHVGAPWIRRYRGSTE